MLIPEDAFKEEIPWVISMNGSVAMARVKEYSEDAVTLFVHPSALSIFEEEGLSQGTTVTARVDHETGIYRLGLLFQDSLIAEPDAMVTLLFSEEMDRTQRREAFRVRVLLDAKIACGPTFSKVCGALIKDLSETGVKVWAEGIPDELISGGNVRVDFFAQDLGSQSIHGEVMWLANKAFGEASPGDDLSKVSWITPTMEGKEMGIRFVDANSDQVAQMRSYLWKIQRERSSRD